MWCVLLIPNIDISSSHMSTFNVWATSFTVIAYEITALGPINVCSRGVPKSTSLVFVEQEVHLIITNKTLYRHYLKSGLTCTPHQHYARQARYLALAHLRVACPAICTVPAYVRRTYFYFRALCILWKLILAQIPTQKWVAHTAPRGGITDARVQEISSPKLI